MSNVVPGTWRSQIVDVRAFAAYKCALFYQHAPNDSFHLNITHRYTQDDNGNNEDKRNNKVNDRDVTLSGSNDINTLKWLRGIALLEWILDFIPDNYHSMSSPTLHNHLYWVFVCNSFRWFLITFKP
jgi:hypothetical protein